MRPGHAAFDDTGWGDAPVLLAFPVEDEAEGPRGHDVVVDDAEGFTDNDVTPAVDSFRELERAYFSEGHWEELVSLFVERAESAADPAERTLGLGSALAPVYTTSY